MIGTVGADVRPRRNRYLIRLVRVLRRVFRVIRLVSIVGGLFFGGYHGLAMLRAAPFLTVDRLVVRGNVQLSEGEVLTLMSGVVGMSIFEVDLETQRQRLEASPWLLGGTLRRIFPSTIEVVVHERHPMALARFTDRLYLVDSSGALLDRHGPRFADIDFPIVDGLAADGVSTPMVVPARMALASRVLEELGTRPEMLEAVSQIDVSDPYNAIVLLNDDPALLHLGGDRFLERLRFYAELAPTLRERVDGIDYVDLRFGQRIFVGPTGD